MYHIIDCSFSLGGLLGSRRACKRKAIDTFQFYLCHTYKLEIEFDTASASRMTLISILFIRLVG